MMREWSKYLEQMEEEASSGPCSLASNPKACRSTPCESDNIRALPSDDAYTDGQFAQLCRSKLRQAGRGTLSPTTAKT
eukprot:61388-Rhodomonas_salina.3